MKTDFVPTSKVVWSFLYLGFCALLGFNCILNAMDFFCNPMVYPAKFGDDAGLYYGLAMNIGLVGLIFFGSLLRGSFRVLLGLGSIVTSLVGLGMICLSRSGTKSDAKTWDVVLMLCLMGLGTSLVQGYFISLAAQFGGMPKFSTGQALAGLLCLPFALCSKYLFEGVLSTSTPFKQTQTSRGVFILFCAALIAAGIPVFFRNIAGLTAPSAAVAGDMEAGKRRSLVEIVKDIFPMASMIWLNFFMLFLIFPSFVVAYWTRHPSGSTVPLKLKYDVAGYLFFFVFNLGDCCGRLLVDYGVKLMPRQVIGMSCIRVALTGLVMFITCTQIGFFANDIFRIFTLFIFIMLQGLTVTWGFIHAPAKISNPAEHAVVGNLTSLFLANGILMGQVIGKESHLMDTLFKSLN